MLMSFSYEIYFPTKQSINEKLLYIPAELKWSNLVTYFGVQFMNQRFLPSEFGIDVDRHHAVEPAASFFGLKAKIRRTIEAEGIPYTYIISNAFAGYSLLTLGQQNATAPPRDKVVILGDGNVKGKNKKI